MFLIPNALQTEFRAWFYAHQYVVDVAHVRSVKQATAVGLE
jgi:hypothetical protein